MTDIENFQTNARIAAADIDGRGGRAYFTERDGVHRMLIAPSANVRACDRIALLNVAEGYQRAASLLHRTA